MGAVDLFGLPHLAMSDTDRKNIVIVKLMIENRGLNKGSFIVRGVEGTELWSELNSLYQHTSKPFPLYGKCCNFG